VTMSGLSRKVEEAFKSAVATRVSHAQLEEVLAGMGCRLSDQQDLQSADYWLTPNGKLFTLPRLHQFPASVAAELVLTVRELGGSNRA
jgi:hypothetical protein